MAKIDFATAIPTSYRLIGSISTFDYLRRTNFFREITNRPLTERRTFLEITGWITFPFEQASGKSLEYGNCKNRG